MKMQISSYLLYILIFIYLKVISCQVTQKTNNVLSRKKRYLSFPDNSNFVITASGIKNIMLNNPPGFITLIELDVLFKLPPLSEKKKIKKYFYHHRHRREIYKEISRAIETFGYDGESCIIRTLCEVKYLYPNEDNSLFQHLIATIFLNAQNNTNIECNEFTNSKCEFSLLNLIFHHIYQG